MNWRSKIKAGTIKVNKVPAESTLSRYHAHLKNDILPIIGDIPIDQVQADDIRKILHNIIARGANETAHRTHSTLTKIWHYAILFKMTNNNVPGEIIKEIELPKYTHVHFRSIHDPTDIRRFWKALPHYRGEYITKMALKFLVLTAVRPGNIRNAKWESINVEKSIWTIPAEDMKSDREFIVPLSKQALTVLEEVRPFTEDSPYIFPSSRGKTRRMSENTLNVAIKNLDFGHLLVSHGIRSMFSTIANEYGHFSHEEIDKALSHKVGNKTEQAYNRSQYLEKRRKVMQWWADWLENLSEYKNV